ncbi:MAG: hypothetical protein HKN50_12265 [Gammaproteobacteria bacterium]|nr:hypothetical protein [Gammaproteobacteria bacterium]
MKLSVIFLLVMLTLPLFAVSAEPNVFHMYGSVPAGRNFPSILATSNIPYDKNFTELTEAQRSLVRANYEGLAAADVPPYPAQGVEQILEPLSKAHPTLLGRGKMLALAMVSAQGKVTEVKIYYTPNKHVSEIISAALFKTEFTPGTCAGVPCAMEYLFEQDLQGAG